MAFKMNGSPAKMGTISGTAGHGSALKMRSEEIASAFKYSTNKDDAPPPIPKDEKAKDKKMANKDWKKGEAKAKSSGRDLNALVKSRKGMKKGSDEYNATQNQINKALNSKKRHGVTESTSEKGKKASTTKVTPGISTKTKTTKGRKTTTEYDRDSGQDRTDVVKVRKDGTKKKVVIKEQNKATTEGTTDKKTVKKYDKEGDVKKTKVKYKTDTDGVKGYERKGKQTKKYNKEGKAVSTKNVTREGGRRTVTKTDSEGNKTTKSRRTLKGFLTGKGKKKKEDSPADIKDKY